MLSLSQRRTLKFECPGTEFVLVQNCRWLWTERSDLIGLGLFSVVDMLVLGREGERWPLAGHSTLLPLGGASSPQVGHPLGAGTLGLRSGSKKSHCPSNCSVFLIMWAASAFYCPQSPDITPRASPGKVKGTRQFCILPAMASSAKPFCRWRP